MSRAFSVAAMCCVLSFQAHADGPATVSHVIAIGHDAGKFFVHGDCDIMLFAGASLPDGADHQLVVGNLVPVRIDRITPSVHELIEIAATGTGVTIPNLPEIEEKWNAACSIDQPV